MKQLIKNYLHIVLSNFKPYRKKIGGTWYKLYLNGTETGHAAGITFWTQEPDKEVDYAILDEENYL